jgi:hypothetical protein
MGAASACFLVGCGDDDDQPELDDDQQELDDGFPSSGIGTIGDPETSFRAAMSSFHVAPDDIDCMVEAYGFDSSATAGTATIGFSGEMLDALAEECNIDTSKLSFSSD